MWHFIVENGKIKKFSKEEYSRQKGRPLKEVFKGMSPEELERFRKERYEKYIKPMMQHNMKELLHKRINK